MCGCAEALVRAVVAFFDAVLVDCFLSWFRPRRRPGPDSPASAHRDPLVPKDRGGEALRASDEEKGFAESTGSNEQLLADGDGTDEELRREADYLKLYGTISQTPAELRNVSYESNSESANESDDMSINGLAMGATSVSGFNSSERLKCEEDLMTELEVSQDKSLDSVPRSVLHDKSQKRLSDCNGSPFPTPLVLRDEMQTPGTIYTSHTGSTMSRKRVRTRKQFVYPVLRPIENKLQQTELPEDSSPMLPSSSKLQHTSSNSVAEVGFLKSLPFSYPIENSSHKEKGSPPSEESKCQTRSLNLLDGGALSKSISDEKHAAMSLTHWLKPLSTVSEDQGVVSSSASDQPRNEDTLCTESPVFTAASGMDADVENPTPRFPKAWEGNCIPNTTKKYKEDQKVSWHTTPFEERLLRVLSDEQPNSPRKLTRGDLFHVEEET